MNHWLAYPLYGNPILELNNSAIKFFADSVSAIVLQQINWAPGDFLLPLRHSLPCL